MFACACVCVRVCVCVCVCVTFRRLGSLVPLDGCKTTGIVVDQSTKLPNHVLSLSMDGTSRGDATVHFALYRLLLDPFDWRCCRLPF